MIVHACHCADCQRLTGSHYATNAWIEKDRVELVSGAPQCYGRQGGSGSDHQVFFCGRCGTTVYSDYRRVPGNHWFVRVGTLDNPALLAPDVHIHTCRKHPAVTLPPGVLTFEAGYDRAKVWPPESLARMEANIRANPQPA